MKRGKSEWCRLNKTSSVYVIAILSLSKRKKRKTWNRLTIAFFDHYCTLVVLIFYFYRINSIMLCSIALLHAILSHIDFFLFSFCSSLLMFRCLILFLLFFILCLHVYYVWYYFLFFNLIYRVYLFAVILYRFSNCAHAHAQPYTLLFYVPFGKKKEDEQTHEKIFIFFFIPSKNTSFFFSIFSVTQFWYYEVIIPIELTLSS